MHMISAGDQEAIGKDKGHGQEPDMQVHGKVFLPYAAELLQSNDVKRQMIGCCMTACDVKSPMQVCRLLCMV